MFQIVLLNCTMMDGVRINEEGVPIEHETVKETNVRQ